jgi:HEAT repeat protein
MLSGDPEAPPRMAAAEALALTGDPAAVPALVRALKNPHSGVRMVVARALGTVGARAQDAVPALERALEDDEAPVREAARAALAKIRRP